MNLFNRILFLWVLSVGFATSHGVTQVLFNQAYQTATHNSYWVERRPHEAFASGVRERILDQLLFEGVRSVEIDIHKNVLHRGEWDVYHTRSTTNSFCTSLRDCLRVLKLFHYVLPQHEPVTVMLELKEILGSNFDLKHTPEDLDQILENELGDLLYSPKEFLSRCPARTSMRDCARTVGWPDVSALRGKFIFTVLGNWHWKFFGRGGKDWAQYAIDGAGVAARAAFPMISDWPTGERIPSEKYEAARDASVFVQAEDYSDPTYLAHLKKLLADNLMIRMDFAFSRAQQEDQVKQGFQYLQTDFPWVKFDDRSFAEPLRGLDGTKLVEPGVRNLLHAGEVLELRSGSAAGADIETLVSSSIPTTDAAYPNSAAARGRGCIELTGSAEEYFKLCREVVSAKPSYLKKKQSAESIVLTVVGHDSTGSFYSAMTEKKGAGDLLRVRTHFGIGDEVCVEAFTAREAPPVWKPVASRCFKINLPTASISAAGGDVLFVGTKIR